jgi:hypothetical protein
MTATAVRNPFDWRTGAPSIMVSKAKGRPAKPGNLALNKPVVVLAGSMVSLAPRTQGAIHITTAAEAARTRQIAPPHRVTRPARRRGEK